MSELSKLTTHLKSTIVHPGIDTYTCTYAITEEILRILSSNHHYYSESALVL